MNKPIPINPIQVRKLAQIGATVKEIADFFNCSDTTINNRFQSELNAGRADMKLSLRKAQMDLAMEGNATLLIWLGKQVLNQTDAASLAISTEHRLVMDSAIEKDLIKKLSE